jgi:5'(3')-deoxyribonucleotidase
MTERESEKVALIDLDGTLADYYRAMTEELLRKLSPGEDLPDNLYDDNAPIWLKGRMQLVKNRPGFWRSLPKIRTGFVVFGLLGALGYRRMILTKGPRRTTAAWTEKLDWCNEHVPDADVTITMDKGLVYGKVLFDDYPPYIKRWLQWRPRGKVLMLDAKHNQGFEHSQVFRVEHLPRAYTSSERTALELRIRMFLEGQ